MDNSDVEEKEKEKEEDEDEDEKKKEKEGCAQRRIVEKNDMSLRQQRKMFKEQLQLIKKKMDNAKVEKVRTTLQPLYQRIRWALMNWRRYSKCFFFFKIGQNLWAWFKLWFASCYFLFI